LIGVIADVYGFGPMRSSTLVQALSAGRAVLVLGQRHSPGLLDGLRLDVAAITGQTDSADLVRLLAAVTDDSSLEGLRRAFERRPVTPELLAIAENPWAYVLTSAIDPQVHEAFGGVLNVEINHSYKLTRPCFKRGKISSLSRHLHF